MTVSKKCRTRGAVSLSAAAVVAAALLGPAPAAEAATAKTIYVNPTSGSDSNSGDSATAALKTVAAAQAAVRKANSAMTGDIVVSLASGTYPLTSPLTLTQADSGTKGYTVRWQAASGAKPVFTGAAPVTGWTAVGNGQYKASVGSRDFRQLVVNGARATRAASPDQGSWYQILSSDRNVHTITVPSASVGSWISSGSVEMVLETQWGESYLRVKSATTNGATTTLTFQDAEANILFNRPYPLLSNGSPFHWENSAAFLDELGEWYLDKAAGTVYYLPRAGEDMSTATVSAPAAETLVDVSGTSLDAPASNISISGITFTGTTWMLPSQSGYLNGQGGLYNVKATMQNQQYVGRPPAALHVSDADSISVTGNVFTDVGSTALDLDHGTHSSSAVGNVVNGASGNGIMIGKFSDPTVEFHTLYDPPNSPAGEDVREVATNNTVSNNLITRIGLDYYGTAGINAGWTSGTTITHNEISDVPWAGISVGWGWQHNAGAAKNNTVNNNEIFNALTRFCDTGAIYHLSVDPGSTFSNNYIHDILRTPSACSSSVAGFYFDEGSDQLTAANNVISHVDQDIQRNATGSQLTLTNNTSSGKSVIQAAGLESAYRGLRATVDLAQGKTATASSTYSSAFTAAKAVDGSSATGWGSTGSDTKPWWQVDLGKAYTLGQIQVVARQDMDQPVTRTGYEVQVSNDATFASYATVGTTNGFAVPDAGSAAFDVHSRAAWRYVRVQKTDGQFAYIADVRVLGAPGATGPAPVDPGTTAASSYEIVNQNSGKVVDVPNASTSDGAKLIQWTETGAANQQWSIQPVGGGLYRIVNRGSGLAMAVDGAKRNHGAAIVQTALSASDGQRWYFDKAANGAFVIRSFGSDQALEVGGDSTDAGASLDQWIPLNQPNQTWMLKKVG